MITYKVPIKINYRNNTNIQNNSCQSHLIIILH